MRHLVFEHLPGRREHYHCGVTRVAPGMTTFLHDHDFPEMFLVRDGAGTNQLRDGGRSVEAGMLVWIKPADRHSLATGTQSMEIINLALAPRWWKHFRELFRSGLDPDAAGEPVAVHLNADEAARLDEAWIQLLAPGVGEDWQLLQAVKLGAEFLHRPKPADTPRNPPAWLEELRHLMRNPLHLGQTVNWWQNRSGCSREHLARSCRKYYGRTLTELLNDARIAWIRQELLSSRKTVTALAMDAGFSHLGHFHALFKSAVGTTPGEWQRQNAAAIVPRKTGGPGSR